MKSLTMKSLLEKVSRVYICWLRPPWKVGRVVEEDREAVSALKGRDMIVAVLSLEMHIRVFQLVHPSGNTVYRNKGVCSTVVLSERARWELPLLDRVVSRRGPKWKALQLTLQEPSFGTGSTHDIDRGR